MECWQDKPEKMKEIINLAKEEKVPIVFALTDQSTKVHKAFNSLVIMPRKWRE